MTKTVSIPRITGQDGAWTHGQYWLRLSFDLSASTGGIITFPVKPSRATIPNP